MKHSINSNEPFFDIHADAKTAKQKEAIAENDITPWYADRALQDFEGKEGKRTKYEA